MLHVPRQQNAKTCLLLCYTNFTWWINYAVNNSTSYYLLKTSQGICPWGLKTLLIICQSLSNIWAKTTLSPAQNSTHKFNTPFFLQHQTKVPPKHWNRLPLFNPCNPQKYSKSINVSEHMSGHLILTTSPILHLGSGLQMLEIACMWFNQSIITGNLNDTLTS